MKEKHVLQHDIIIDRHLSDDIIYIELPNNR